MIHVADLRLRNVAGPGDCKRRIGAIESYVILGTRYELIHGIQRHRKSYLLPRCAGG